MCLSGAYRFFATISFLVICGFACMLACFTTLAVFAPDFATFTDIRKQLPSFDCWLYFVIRYSSYDW